MKKPKPVKARDCSVIAMCDGRNEANHPTVIQEGRVMQYVGIGWVDEGPATKEDYLKYPEVKG